MRRTWGSIGLSIVLLMALAGCEQTLKQKLRPAQQPEAYNLPPADDPRFQKPIEYPKGTLNKDETKISRDLKDAKDGAPGGPGAGGGGMGGMGAPGGH